MTTRNDVSSDIDGRDLDDEQALFALSLAALYGSHRLVCYRWEPPRWMLPRMNMRGSSRSATFAVGLMVLITTVGCGQERPHSVGYSAFKGLLPGYSGTGFDAALVPTRDVVAVTAYGSGTCPTVPVSVHISGAHLIKVEMDGSYSGACTADAAPTTTLIKLDLSSLSVDDGLRVQYSGAGSGRIRPRILTTVPTKSTPYRSG